MLGVEMMFANMIGMKPEELKTAVTGVINAIQQGAETLKRIEQKLDKVLAEENEKDNFNGGRKLPSPRNREHIEL